MMTLDMTYSVLFESLDLIPYSVNVLVSSQSVTRLNDTSEIRHLSILNLRWTVPQTNQVLDPVLPWTSFFDWPGHTLSTVTSLLLIRGSLQIRPPNHSYSWDWVSRWLYILWCHSRFLWKGRFVRFLIRPLPITWFEVSIGVKKYSLCELNDRYYKNDRFQFTGIQSVPG